MRTAWHDMWGSGCGPASRLAPQSRFLAGGVLFLACLAAPAVTGRGIVFIMAVTLAWTVACGMPWRAARSFALLGLAMFLPYFLLVPLLAKEATSSARWSGFATRLAVPWDIFLHGMAGMIIAAATVTALSASDLRCALLALPIPHVVSAVIIQIVHQISELSGETKRITAAAAVRAASGSGRIGLRLLASLPRVWLPRIIHRADRVAAAMELRSYTEADRRIFGRKMLGASDYLSILGVLGALAMAVAFRWRLI